MLPNILQDLIIDTHFYEFLRNYYQKKAYKKWLQSGRSGPSPHIEKQKVIREFANKNKIHVFVETGTYLGEMVFAVKDLFKKIYSIELSERLYKRAKIKFSKCQHISILQGDSSFALPKVLTQIEERCLFWLDGHYSGGITAKGEKETPILDELKNILNSPISDHIILIDDARCFTGNNDYPTLNELKEFTMKRFPNYNFEVKDDIIRIYKFSL